MQKKNPSCEDEEVDYNDNRKEEEEEGMILETVMDVPNMNKPSLKFEVIEQKMLNPMLVLLQNERNN